MAWDSNLTVPGLATVEPIAKKMMADEDQVTSLDLKKAIRNAGHIYRQEDASEFLMQHSVSLGWIFQDAVAGDGSIYRVYTVPDPDDDDNDDSAPSSGVAPSASLASLAATLDAADDGLKGTDPTKGFGLKGDKSDPQ